MLGLELLDGGAVAVAMDEAGVVLGRAEVAGADVALAACAAAEHAPASSANVVAVASLHPESPASIAAMRTLDERFGAALVRGSAVPSGTAAAVAEAWVGAARGAKEVVYFSVADHTSAGILRDGLPVTGAHRRAASVAWLALNPVEREDYRKAGCLEAEVAASGIVRRLVWRIKAGDRSRVQDAAGGDLAAVSIDLVLSAARTGDGVAISVMRDTAKYLGMAAANLVVIDDPEVLVLGGIMASAADLLLEPVRSEIARRLQGSMMQALTIVPATLGGDAPAIGAARLAAATPR
jgi:predicted NBD/HSP70 family sugar kinase